MKFKELGFEVTGIDNSQSGIAICEKKGFKVFRMDAASMKFGDNSFDVVFAEGLLEHFEDYEPFVREMIRVSKKYILLVQPNAHSILGKIVNIATEKLTKGNVKEIPYKMADFVKSFRKHGCKLLVQRPAALNTYVILL